MDERYALSSPTWCVASQYIDAHCVPSGRGTNEWCVCVFVVAVSVCVSLCVGVTWNRNQRVLLAKHASVARRQHTLRLRGDATAVVTLEDNYAELQFLAAIAGMPHRPEYIVGLHGVVHIQRTEDHPRGMLVAVLEGAMGGELFTYNPSDKQLPIVDALRLFQQFMSGAW